MPLQRSDCGGTTLGKVCATCVAIYEMRIATENIRAAAILLVRLAMRALVSTRLRCGDLNLYIGMNLIFLGQATARLRNE